MTSLLVRFIRGTKVSSSVTLQGDQELLPDNFALCTTRLASLLKRLSLRTEISKHYSDVIQEQLKQEIIEPVEKGVNSGVGKARYIPHHEVTRVDKETTKLRVVYDASARAGRNSPSFK